MHRHSFGKFLDNTVAGERTQCYVPDELPPNTPVDMNELYGLLDKANLAIGRLDGVSVNVPDISLFLYMYIRKEAVLSSQIEGTQSTLNDLLRYENTEMQGAPTHDILEVSNYVAALEHGLGRVADGFPLCLRLIREMHEILMGDSRGSNKQPGMFRRSQNWIGGTKPSNASYVPPPWEKIADLLANLEKYWQPDNKAVPTLIKAGFAHYQFETIHPFLDGNGRLGRLLITFILCIDGVLAKPLLYLSLYFKIHRKAYYEHLQYVRETGDIEEWLKFFLQGVIYTSGQAVNNVSQVLELLEDDRRKIRGLGKSHVSALAIHDILKKAPICDPVKIATLSGLSQPTVNSTLRNLVELEILREVTGRQRNKLYNYSRYLTLLSGEHL